MSRTGGQRSGGDAGEQGRGGADEARTVILDAEALALAAPPPRRRETSLMPGDLLNGIYRVERFIAHGGMGDVFEGVNVESEERVAIKAVRSHLAADPKVLAMFRKEARVLTRIAHPAIVQYRVLARDPSLELLYIVTDYIDGEPLSAVYDGHPPELPRIVELARRLASGLRTAHELGAIHRDMSPDNILLPAGRLEQAKIIDFGIAKILETGAETVIGDGFAGKIGYVAPEQFGDFDRQVGPWTDVYSMALVLLAFARGAAPDMGRTLSEAVEKRRAPVDLDGAPEALKPLLARMLVPDPAQRIRSMDVVLDGLDAIPSGDAPAAPPPPPSPSPPAPLPRPVEPLAAVPPADAPVFYEPPAPRPLRPVWIGSALALLVAALLAWSFWPRAPHPAPATPGAPTRIAAIEPGTLPVSPSPRTRDLLGAVECAWLSEQGDDNGVLRLGGAALRPDRLADALLATPDAKALKLTAIDASAVVPLPAQRCATIHAMRALDPGPIADLGISAASTTLVAAANDPVCPPGQGARADLTLVARDPTHDFALLMIRPDGALLRIVAGRLDFLRLARQDPAHFRLDGNGRFLVSACYGRAGTTGMILLDGPSPLRLGWPDGRSQAQRGFLDRFVRMSTSEGWRARALWLQVLPAPTALSAASPANRPVFAGDRPLLAGASPATLPAGADLTNAASPAPAAPDGSSSPDATRAPADYAACRAYNGHSWEELGYASKAGCVDRMFRNRCDIVSGQFGNSPLRRYAGRIEASDGKHWSTLGRQQACAGK